MCGILAYLGIKPGSKYVLEGIKILRNRGYDSVGCCSIHSTSTENQNPTQAPSHKNKTIITKYANTPTDDSFSRFEATYQQTHQNSNLLMAHCRWATCGQVSDENSHPHQDTLNQNISIVHNGIITNHEEIRDFLSKKGIQHQSETDTETIVNLIAYFKSEGNSIQKSIKESLQQLEGTWGLVIIDHTTPEPTLFVCRKGSPILIAYSDEMCIVSSEISGFSNYLKNYFVVPDSAMITVRLTSTGSLAKIKIERDDQNLSLEKETKTLGDTVIHPVTPDPYPHWTLKEIHDQVQSVRQALNFGGRLQSDSEVHLGGLAQHRNSLLTIQHLTILASGTSFHAGLLGKKYFQQLNAFQTIQVIDAGEFSPQDIQTPPSSSGILLISQSGETRDIIRCLEDIRSHNHLQDLPIFSTVNVVGSLIARESDCGVYLNCGREVGVAATKSFLSQCIVLILIGLWFSQNRHPTEEHPKTKTRNRKIITELHNIHSLVEQTLNHSIIQTIEETAEHILTPTATHASPHSTTSIAPSSTPPSSQSLFILGHNEGLSIAKEGALKIKEISYLHAEAYSSAGLKHGPLALIEKGTPIIVVRLPGQTTKVDTSAEETKARGAYLISISHEKCHKANLYDKEIIIPHSPTLSPILSTIPLQYLAYFLSSKQGLSVDFPKNLAKCVTTD